MFVDVVQMVGERRVRIALLLRRVVGVLRGGQLHGEVGQAARPHVRTVAGRTRGRRGRRRRAVVAQRFAVGTKIGHADAVKELGLSDARSLQFVHDVSKSDDGRLLRVRRSDGLLGLMSGVFSEVIAEEMQKTKTIAVVGRRICVVDERVSVGIAVLGSDGDLTVFVR